MLLMDIWILTIFLGTLVGIVAAFFGIGGGVLFVPILILLFNYDTKVAIGTSLLAVFITSLSSVAAYAKRRRINYRLGLMLETASIPGAILGAYLVTVMPVDTLRTIFSFFLFLLATKLMLKRKKHYEKKSIGVRSRSALIKAEALSFIAGMLSAMLGIGGGVLKVPVMLLVLDVPVHKATATSSFMVAITSFVGLTQHILHGYVDFTAGLLLGMGAILGAQIGIYLSDRTKLEILRRLFAVLLMAIAIELLLK